MRCLSSARLISNNINVRLRRPRPRISVVFIERLLDGASADGQLDTFYGSEGLGRGREAQHGIRVVCAQQRNDIPVRRRQQ